MALVGATTQEFGGWVCAPTTAGKEIEVSLSISCNVFDPDCKDVVTGESLQDLVHEVQHHAIDAHAWSRKGVSSPDFMHVLVSALRQTVRPEEIRSVDILDLSELIKNAPESKKAP